MAAVHTSAPANEPTAYTSRIVATGLATASGALLTSLIDSRGTLVGAVLVAMTVSALGQAMRGPLDRLERRIKALGVARGILIVGLVGFLLGAGAAGARDILQGGQWTARIARTLRSVSTEQPARPAPTAPVSDDEDAKTTQDKPAARPTADAEKKTADAEKKASAQPAPAPNHAADPVPSGPDRP